MNTQVPLKTSGTSSRFLQHALFGIAALMASVQLTFADSVTTNNGSILTGTITKITGGSIHLDTGFSGIVKIDQTQVIRLETANMVNVRLSKGSTLLGQIAPGAQPPQILVRTGNGVFSAEVPDVVDVWQQDLEDPVVTALKAKQTAEKRKWSYTAGLNFNGQNGNSEEFGLAANFAATLKGPQDKLKFYFSVLNSERNGQVSANETKGGVDYASILKDKYGWYTRFELEKDEFEALDMRSTTAAGISYKLLEEADRSLGFRAGFAYRHESYSTGDTFEDPAMDLGLDYHMIYKDMFKLDTTVTFVPDFSEFTENYRLAQDTGVSIPFVKSQLWSLRLGFSNDYNSQPVNGREELDTRYYTRLQFDWGD